MSEKLTLKKMKMKCPECGADLIPRKFIDTCDSEGKPQEVNEYLVCEKCGVAWMALELDTMEPYIEQRSEPIEFKLKPKEK